MAGGSYASLRDLADYGACLAFDDAENLSDPKRSDPDKRTLLLAGNRRGNTVPVKEPGPDKTWRTRHVNTFCPRLFSAIRLPDGVLASRSLVVPLIRTIDRAKANADPLDYKLWPHDRRKLLDDLWALSLTSLPQLPQYEALVNEQASLTGRNLEPWRALLAVAKWLQDSGMDELWKRMEELSRTYQQERPGFESSDFTRLAIHALIRCTGTSISSILSMASIMNGGGAKCWILKTKDITEAAKAVATEDELDMDPERVTSRRIGRVLGQLRLKKDPDTSKRAWLVTPIDLARLAVSFGFVGSANTDPPAGNAGNAGNACNACPDEGSHKVKEPFEGSNGKGEDLSLLSPGSNGHIPADYLDAEERTAMQTEEEPEDGEVAFEEADR